MQEDQLIGYFMPSQRSSDSEIRSWAEDRERAAELRGIGRSDSKLGVVHIPALPETMGLRWRILRFRPTWDT